MPEAWLSIATGAVGLLAGALLGAWRDVSAERRRHDESRRNAYAAWLTDAEIIVGIIAMDQEGDMDLVRRFKLRTRELELLETDEHARTLMQTVAAAIPLYFTPEREALVAWLRANPGGGAGWPTFSKAADDLIKHVRESLRPRFHWPWE